MGKNGVITQAQGASTETTKAKFIEDAEMAYSDAYTDKTKEYGPNAVVTTLDIVNKLIDEYGYKDSITTVINSSGNTRYSSIRVKC